MCVETCIKNKSPNFSIPANPYRYKNIYYKQLIYVKGSHLSRHEFMHEYVWLCITMKLIDTKAKQEILGVNQ